MTDPTAATKAILPSEWKRRRKVVFAVVALCCVLILASWVYGAWKGENAAIEKIVDSAFYLLGFVVAVYVGAPVADDAFHKFAIAKIAGAKP